MNDGYTTSPFVLSGINLVCGGNRIFIRLINEWRIKGQLFAMTAVAEKTRDKNLQSEWRRFLIFSVGFFGTVHLRHT